MKWQRVDSYKATGDPVMNSGSFDPTSSAAEWICPLNGGKYGVVTDEVFGIGLLNLDPSGTSGDGGGRNSGGDDNSGEDSVDGGDGNSASTILGFTSAAVAVVTAVALMA